MVSSSRPFLWAYAGARRLNVAGAVSDESVPSLGGLLPVRPEYPLSLSFSTPIAITTSYAPDATA